MKLPEGWDVKCLSDLTSKISDGIHKTPLYADFSNVYFINGNNLKNGSVVIQDSTKFVDEIDALNHKKDLNDRTLLMSINGTIGNLAYYKGENVVLGKSASYINVKNDVDVDFVYYFLSSQKTQDFYESELTGTTIRNLSIKSIKSTQMCVPPFPEQQKIAKILSTWDKAISTTAQLLANSQQQKKALMQQLLTGQRRLLDDDGLRFSGEWVETKISKTGKVVSGGTPDTDNKDFWDGNINWITPTDVTALVNRFVYKTARTITTLGVANSSATILPKGSLLICTRATIGAMAISTSEICTNQGFKSIIPNKSFDVEFLYYILKKNVKLLIRKASGSTFLEISKKDFESIELSMPSLTEQQKIAAVLSAADQEISTLQQQLATLKQEKKALMQQLLTGKVRVKLTAPVGAN